MCVPLPARSTIFKKGPPFLKKAHHFLKRSTKFEKVNHKITQIAHFLGPYFVKMGLIILFLYIMKHNSVKNASINRKFPYVKVHSFKKGPTFFEKVCKFSHVKVHDF